MGQPRPLFNLFSSFQTRITIFATNKHDMAHGQGKNVKMSIQYTVPRFELTTFGTRNSSHNHYTRSPAQYKFNLIFAVFSPFKCTRYQCGHQLIPLTSLLQHRGIVYAYHPAAAGSNPEHTIYTFSICIIEIAMRKGRK